MPRSQGKTKLAEIRRWRGLTQEELAAATGVALTTIYKLESGKTQNPKVRHLRNLSIALGVPFDALLEEEWKVWTEFDARAKEPDLDDLLGPWHKRAPR